MSYQSKAEAIEDGRCGVELESGEYCGGLPVSAFGEYRDLSHYDNPARCKHHQGQSVGLADVAA
jgi:hypothetical protein